MSDPRPFTFAQVGKLLLAAVGVVILSSGFTFSCGLMNEPNTESFLFGLGLSIIMVGFVIYLGWYVLHGLYQFVVGITKSVDAAGTKEGQPPLH